MNLRRAVQRKIHIAQARNGADGAAKKIKDPMNTSWSCGFELSSLRYKVQYVGSKCCIYSSTFRCRFLLNNVFTMVSIWRGSSFVVLVTPKRGPSCWSWRRAFGLVNCRVQHQRCWEFWGTEGSSHWMLILVAWATRTTFVLCASPGAWSPGNPPQWSVTGAMQIGNWMDGDGDRHQLPLRLKIESMGPTQDRFHQIRNERRSYMQRIPRRWSWRWKFLKPVGLTTRKQSYFDASGQLGSTCRRTGPCHTSHTLCS